MVSVECAQCGTNFQVTPARKDKARFCSIKCRSDWRKVHFSGVNNPNWKGGSESDAKDCPQCGKSFTKGKQPLTSWKTRKFCSKACADQGGFRYAGADHANWTGGKRKRDFQHARWAQRIISRDGAMCRTCGAKGVELHAHHIKGWKEHPELRFKMSNGITLCARCHWAVHSASNENAVNSGNPQHELGGGNPEPSADRKVREGVTTRGRAYRRVEGHCGHCGTFLSRRASNALGRTGMFCNRSCSMSFTQARLKEARAKGSNASKSAAPERDDIV